jgi:hypothetical protein
MSNNDPPETPYPADFAIQLRPPERFSTCTFTNCGVSLSVSTDGSIDYFNRACELEVCVEK